MTIVYLNALHKRDKFNPFLYFTAKPETVTKCEVEFRSSWDDRQPVLKCIPGWNGGLNQTFVLEVLKAKNIYSRPIALVKHSLAPNFNLDSLDPGEEYLLIVTANNAKGTSSPFTLSYRAPRPPNLSPSSSPDAYASKQNLTLSWGVFAGMMLGVFVSVFVCFIGAIYAARRRAAARQFRNAPMAPSSSKEGQMNTSTIQRNLRKNPGNETMKLKTSPLVSRKGMFSIIIGYYSVKDYQNRLKLVDDYIVIPFVNT